MLLDPSTLTHAHETFSPFLSSFLTLADEAVGEVAEAVAEPSTYSRYSYYTTLGLYALSFPGYVGPLSPTHLLTKSQLALINPSASFFSPTHPLSFPQPHLPGHSFREEQRRAAYLPSTWPQGQGEP